MTSWGEPLKVTVFTTDGEISSHTYSLMRWKPEYEWSEPPTHTLAEDVREAIVEAFAIPGGVLFLPDPAVGYNTDHVVKIMIEVLDPEAGTGH